MKKLFLILALAGDAFGMNSENEFRRLIDDISENDPQTIISKQAAPLHCFLTQNLDNQDENPDDKIVDDLAERLNALNLNPSVLLELKDERPERSYTFRKYLTQNGDNRSLRVIFQPTNRTVSLAQESDICEAEKGERLSTIQLYEAEQKSTDFALLKNGDREYEPKSSNYSLVNLLVACKRPRTLFTLLNKSFYVPRFPNALRLKDGCDKNINSDNDDDENDSHATHDWKKLSQAMDDAAELESATSFIVQTKTTVLRILPFGIMLYRNKLGRRGLLTTMLASYLWDPFVDVVEYALNVDEKVASLLSHKSVAHAIIGTSKKCQQLIPEPVKEYFKDEAELVDLVTRWRAQRDALRASERAAKREARKKARA